MIEIRQTVTFARWLKGIRDGDLKGRINARVQRLATGNPGDVRHVGHGVQELRIHFGPGYRIYFTRLGESVYTGFPPIKEYSERARTET